MPTEAPEHRQCRLRAEAEDYAVWRANLLRLTAEAPPIDPVVRYWYDWKPNQGEPT